MSNENPEKGYYSILQYIPNLERAEGANVGVVLFCPNSKFFEIQCSSNNNRVKKFFFNEASTAHFDMFKLAFEERIKAASKNFRDLKDFQYFVDTRANQLQLTIPRPIKVFDPQEEIANLYNLLVDHKPKITETQVSQNTHSVLPVAEIRKQFKDLIKQNGLENKVKENYLVKLLPYPIKVPFAYQNGKLNVIEPVQFKASDVELNIQRASKLAIESNGLSHLPISVKLNVIGSFRFDQKESVPEIEKILEQYNGKLYSVENLEPLIEEIKTQAHSIG